MLSLYVEDKKPEDAEEVVKMVGDVIVLARVDSVPCPTIEKTPWTRYSTEGAEMQ